MSECSARACRRNSARSHLVFPVALGWYRVTVSSSPSMMDSAAWYAWSVCASSISMVLPCANQAMMGAYSELSFFFLSLAGSGNSCVKVFRMARLMSFWATMAGPSCSPS